MGKTLTKRLRFTWPDPPTRPASPTPKQLHGKELSYINLLDADAALSAVKDLKHPGACIVKHATPCGLAMADDIAKAFITRL
ncbi:MAG: hypothetical protein KatS3mg104_0177 [Phycisphaerae bacterium]|nr:MAG: hypothetical protein KatS3mg104_0177 [Phycisphaerae bacterium]